MSDKLYFKARINEIFSGRVTSYNESLVGGFVEFLLLSAAGEVESRVSLANLDKVALLLGTREFSMSGWGSDLDDNFEPSEKDPSIFAITVYGVKFPAQKRKAK